MARIIGFALIALFIWMIHRRSAPGWESPYSPRSMVCCWPMG